MSVFAYYALLSSLSAAVNGPINDLATRINIPIVSALLLGLIGAVAPCQLTTLFRAAHPAQLGRARWRVPTADLRIRYDAAAARPLLHHVYRGG